MRSASHHSRGTVSLVALCFVAVLGIVLGSYLAVCSRAMNLSNRSFQAGLSQQLAEFGLDEGLRAFNKGDWSTWASTPTNMSAGAWTLDTTNKRATRTISFNAGKLGQGATATVKIRIDNYDANTLGESWVTSKAYVINDLVGHNGIWYRCVLGNSGNEPTLTGMMTYWVPQPISWAWRPGKTYRQNVDLVCYNGTWYRCTATYTPASGSTFSTTNWASTWFPAPQLVMVYPGWYDLNQYVYRTANDTWYRCTNPHWSASFNAANWEAVSGSSGSSYYINWAYRTTVTYNFDDVVYYNQAWYRYIYPNPASNVAPTTTSHWENALSGGAHGWFTGTRYNMGDAVYHSGTSQWYRCIKAHTSSGTITPGNTTYWSNTPAYSTLWSAGEQYSQNDTVRYRGIWYRCITAHTSSASSTPANVVNWVSATDSSYAWNATTAYAANAYRAYSGVWYKCLVANTGQSPNNTTYWTSTWTNSSNVTTGAPIIHVDANVVLPRNPGNRTLLRAVINPESLFPNAVGTTGTLTITSGTGEVDSYDSTLSSTYTSQKLTATNYSAVLASETSVTISGTTAVRGHLAWPTPAAGISTSTTVKGISSPGTPNVDPARISRSPRVPQFDPLPLGGLATAFTSSNFPKGTQITDPTPTSNVGNTLNLGTPGGTTPSRYYYNGSLTLRDSSPFATININGPVILYVNGNIRTRTTNGTVNINTTGSAEIHVDGGIRADALSGGFRNQTSDPKKLVLISDITSTTTQQLAATTNDFYGVIYTPDTTNTTGLSVGAGVKIYGAISAKEITFTSEATVHYDTSLRYTSTPGVEQPYGITEWRELPITEQPTMQAPW